MKKGFILYPSPMRVLTARKDAKLTQTEAAAVVRVSETAWRNWENGRRKMSLSTFEMFLGKTNQTLEMEF